jgi:septum formation protein
MLEDAGLDVIAVASGVDERLIHDPDPSSLALLLARAKAQAVALRFPDAVVLGADQVLFDGESIYGKPPDPVEHAKRLLAMRGRSHDLVTAFCICAPNGVERQGIERTRMHVRADLTDAEVYAYVATGEGAQCAGGYAIEGHGAWLFEAIDGDWFNVVGLPLLAVMDALRGLGWRYGEA